MSTPQTATLWRSMKAGWSAASTRNEAGFVIRNGKGAGSRVSAASRAADDWDIDAAECAMRGLGQHPLFQITSEDAALDQALAARGYVVKDESCFLTIPATDLASEAPPPVSAFAVWPALAIQRDLWRDGGIGPARLSVMERAAGEKCTLLGRIKDRAAGTGFVVLNDGIAFVHALHVLPEFRRQSLARYMMRRAGIWSLDRGASHVALITTRANTAALALYRGLGFTEAASYHYRQAPLS